MVQILPIVIGIGGLILGTSLTVFIKHLKNVSRDQGYIKASEEFNKKYHKLYEEFMSKVKTWEKNKKEYEEIIRAYEEYIDILKRNTDDLKKNGIKGASSVAIAKLGTTSDLYITGLENEIQSLETCLNNLKMLRKSE